MAIAPGSIFPRNGVAPAQAAPGADTSARATCTELFYTASCNPRFDPQAMNSLISELLNVVNHNCDGTDSTIDWNCARQDNLRTAICRIWEDKWEDCFEVDLPIADDVCGEIRSLVLIDDGTCVRFATYSSSDPARAVGTFERAQPDLPKNVTVLVIPDDFQDPLDYYDVAAFLADVQAGTVNDARIENSMITLASFNLACATRLDLATQLIISNPAMAQDAYATRARLGRRWRVNGGAWNYEVTAGGTLLEPVPTNSLLTGMTWGHGTPHIYPSGNIEIQVFYMGVGGATPTRFVANTNTTASGLTQTPRTNIRPAL